MLLLGSGLCSTHLGLAGVEGSQMLHEPLLEQTGVCLHPAPHMYMLNFINDDLTNDDETNNTHINNNNSCSDHQKKKYACFLACDEIGTSRNPTEVKMFSIGHADKRLRPESVDAVLIMRISKSCKNALVRPGIVTKHTLAVKQAISMMLRAVPSGISFWSGKLSSRQSSSQQA